jgi:hypothetical protein
MRLPVEPIRVPRAWRAKHEEADMAKTLERFTITRAADGFLLTVEDDAGDTLELNATYDQVDVIAEELEAALDADEDLLEVDEADNDDDEEADEK